MTVLTPRSARGDTAYGTLSEERLRALIDNDRQRGDVVVSRGGKISRKHYAHLLGCTRSALTRFAFVFSEYENDIGVVTGPMRHFPEMRKWLHAAYDAQELGVRDGKLDRSAFMAHFNLQGGTFITRHPPIRALFDELDARAECEGYLPSERLNELERVKAVLAARPVLDKDRMTINLVELARAARVEKSRLRDRPFAEAVAARQADIMIEVEANRIDPYVHGRVFPFSELAPSWPIPFLERIGIRFKQIAAGVAQPSAKRPYLQLLALLDWISANTANPHCKAVVIEAGERGRIQSTDDWEEVLFAYRDHLIASTTTDSSVDSAIKALRMMLGGLSSGGVVPVTSTPLPGIKHARRRSGRRRSVAEVGTASDNEGEFDYVAFARDRFLVVSRRSGVDTGAGEADAFVNGLAAELSRSRELPADPAVAIRLTLEHRLDVLRQRAIVIVDAAIKAHRNGCRLLSLTDIDGVAFERDYFDDTLDSYARTQLVRSFFPHPKESTDAQVEKGIANLLGLIRQQHGGIPPLGAVLTLYIIESGSNIGVGRTLDRECMEASDLAEHRRITGHKARAQGKPIIVDLLKTSPAVRAMDWLLTAGICLQKSAGSDADRLFLMQIGGRVQLMTSHWYTNWFKQFVASTPGLEGIYLLPSMLRPSVLLHAALSNDGRLATGMAIGQHGLAVTQGYQQKWPTRLLYDENIRRFNTAFETLVMSGVEDAASKLGITVEQFEARLGDLGATGLGTFCRNRHGRSGETSGTCSTLDCWNDCPHLLIVAEVEAIATLQLWQTSLRAVQPEWERDRAERWDTVWLPWLCLTDVVEEKMARGSLIKVWNAARQRAAEIAAQPGYAPPRPW